MQSAVQTSTYTDFSGFSELRAQARTDPDASLEQVAKQFEGIFIQMMLKSMRDASMGDEIFDSDQSDLYRDMYDKQIALNMAEGKGIGIADSLIRQLRQGKPKTEATKSDDVTIQQFQNQVLKHGKLLPLSSHNLHSVDQSFIRGLAASELSSIKPMKDNKSFNSPEEFTNHILPYAQEAADELGVSPLVLVSQSALETGWGKAVIRKPDGASSYNLFNIKADSRWHGDTVTKSTLEYHNGLAKYEKASFRSYESYADSFNDYVDFLRSNSRYADVIHSQSEQADDGLYIQGLHKAGYATDPNYANKIINILSRDEIQQHASAGNYKVGV
ncbi:MAG: flagellar assembly peptidoglycan hydrolase FlgJ [Woeseiaceae bacterium]